MTKIVPNSAEFAGLPPNEKEAVLTVRNMALDFKLGQNKFVRKHGGPSGPINTGYLETEKGVQFSILAQDDLVFLEVRSNVISVRGNAKEVCISSADLKLLLDELTKVYNALK